MTQSLQEILEWVRTSTGFLNSNLLSLMRLRTAVAVLSQVRCWEQAGPEDVF